MDIMPDRRTILKGTALSIGCGWLSHRILNAADSPPVGNRGFGFSLYGMKKLDFRSAIGTLREIGYDCTEIPVMPELPHAAGKLTKQQRAEMAQLLIDHSIRLSALMENLHLLASPEVHENNLVRLRDAGQLANDLCPKTPPVIETIMGGAPSKWEEDKNRMVDRLGEWAKSIAETKTVLAIKAHVSGSAYLPNHIRWLLDQVQSPWLKAVYDYSHFQLRDVDLQESWNLLASDVAFIHIKDSVGRLNQFRFVLPGEGTIDYPRLFQLFKASQCQADIVVEVSSQIHNQPDYDPVQAAKSSYTSVSPWIEKLRVQASQSNRVPN